MVIHVLILCCLIASLILIMSVGVEDDEEATGLAESGPDMANSFDLKLSLARFRRCVSFSLPWGGA